MARMSNERIKAEGLEAAAIIWRRAFLSWTCCGTGGDEEAAIRSIHEGLQRIREAGDIGFTAPLAVLS